MTGPSGAIFEPKHYLFDRSVPEKSISQADCDSGLVFELAGFGLQVSVEIETGESDKRIRGPSDLKITLAAQAGTFKSESATDSRGVAIFDQVPSTGNKLFANIELPRD